MQKTPLDRGRDRGYNKIKLNRLDRGARFISTSGENRQKAGRKGDIAEVSGECLMPGWLGRREIRGGLSQEFL